MQATQSKKSGKGLSHGVVSEMAAFFGVKPGHAEALRAACQRFQNAITQVDPRATQKTGLRDSRFVMFDDDRRLQWTTTFETDWDPYLDDALLIVGVEHFIDWMQHTVEAEQLGAWLQRVGGVERLGQLTGADAEQTVKASTAGLKRILQSVQVQATSYFNALANQTVPEIRQALRVQAAFQQTLDNPAAAQALQHPALQPLLQLAAD